MCRMVAIASVEAAPVTYELIESPHSLLRQAECGSCGPHADGCGVAYVQNKKIPLHRRGPAQNWDDTFKEIIRSIKGQLVICHNRKASGGQQTDESRSHPFLRTFKGSDVALCHNGTLNSVLDEAKERGVVDTEIFFEEILANQKELTLSTIARRVGELARETKYTSLTAFLLAPNALFAWRLFGDERVRDYYTLSKREVAGRMVIASEPIDKEVGWTLIPNGTIVSATVEGGKLRMQEEKIDCPNLPA